MLKWCEGELIRVVVALEKLHRFHRLQLFRVLLTFDNTHIFIRPPRPGQLWAWPQLCPDDDLLRDHGEFVGACHGRVGDVHVVDEAAAAVHHAVCLVIRLPLADNDRGVPDSGGEISESLSGFPTCICVYLLLLFRGERYLLGEKILLLLLDLKFSVWGYEKDTF